MAMHDLYLGLGTNLGDKEHNISCAIDEINSRIGRVVRQSDFIITEPWGFSSDNTFLNAVICVKTEMLSHEVLIATQQIEKLLGRKEKSFGSYHDRTIDIDILLWDDIQLLSQSLTIPHKLMTKRAFVLSPLAQIVSESFVIPGQVKTIAQLLCDIDKF